MIKRGDAGGLDTEVVFSSAVETPDGGGGVDVTWTDQFTRSAEITEGTLASRMEVVEVGALQQNDRVALRIRIDAETQTITTEWRARFEGEEWNIRRIRPHPSDRRNFYSVICETGGAV